MSQSKLLIKHKLYNIRSMFKSYMTQTLIFVKFQNYKFKTITEVKNIFVAIKSTEQLFSNNRRLGFRKCILNRAINIIRTTLLSIDEFS